MNRLFFALLVSWSWYSVAYAATLSLTVHDTENKPINDAIVMAIPTHAQATNKVKPKTIVIDQIDKEFVNHVTAIPIGTLVLFPNNDNIRHHVYSFSPSKQFELPLYTGTPAKPVLFDKPGVVKLGCNIHDWMVAYIYVVEAPYFSTSNKDGIAQIADLPAGEYNVRIWHPRMETKEEATQQAVIVGTEGVKAAWQLGLKPDFRPRRMPLPMQQGY